MVLRGFSKAPFESLADATVRSLTLKEVFLVAFLVAITSARRVSERQALSIRPHTFHFFQTGLLSRLIRVVAEGIFYLSPFVGDSFALVCPLIKGRRLSISYMLGEAC